MSGHICLARENGINWRDRDNPIGGIYAFYRRFRAGASVLATPRCPTNTGLCDQPKGYIEVYKQFVEGWSDAVNGGTLVDPKKTEIAVWVTAWENRMIAGKSIHALCVDMIGACVWRKASRPAPAMPISWPRESAHERRDIEMKWQGRGGKLQYRGSARPGRRRLRRGRTGRRLWRRARSNPFGQGGGIQIPMGGGRGGFGSIIVIIIFVVIAMVFGINPLSLLTGDTSSTTTQSAPPAQGARKTTCASSSVSSSKIPRRTGPIISRSRARAIRRPRLCSTPTRPLRAAEPRTSRRAHSTARTTSKVYIDLGFYQELRTSSARRAISPRPM